MKLTPKQARRISGISQREMASLLKVSRNTYIKWENHPEQMTVATAKNFSAIVNVEIEDIFFETESNLIRQKEIAI